MDLTCPRCETVVHPEAQYCSYCSLPKPKNGFGGTAEAKPEVTRRTEQPRQVRQPAGPGKNNKEQPRSFSPPVKTPRTKKRRIAADTPERRLRFRVVGVAALVALLSAGIYIFIVPLVYSEHAEPKAVMSALDKLRKMPSSEPGLTIDARLTRELETARRVKNLVSYQGWTARPIKGTSTRVLIAFSYQEVGDINNRAEWIADLTTGTFTPQTDLAAAIYTRKPVESP